MKYQRFLAAGLICSLLIGCGPARTDPLITEPTAEGPVIAYVPLDDRPDNEERVVYLAESLGYTLQMPERDSYRTRLNDQPLNRNGTQFGNRAALYEWVLEQEAAGCDRYVLSMDQLLSGGLVNSRAMTDHEDITLSDGTVLTEYELQEILLTTLASDPNNRVWLLDSVMRLAPTVGYQHWTLEEYNALRAYGTEERPALSEDQLELASVIALYGQTCEGAPFSAADFGLTGEEVTEYLNARVRKLELSDRMMQLLKQLKDKPNPNSEIFKVLIGIDDSSEEDSIQKNEIAYLRSLLREEDALLSGVDDLAFKAVAKLYLEEIEWDGAAISVNYFGGTEDQPACAYDYKPLTEIVAEHLSFFGLTTKTHSGESQLMVLVLTQPDDPEKKEDYCRALIKQLEENRSAQLPTILVDAGNGQYGTSFHEALTAQTTLGWLLSYAGFLDMAIVTGTALSHGVARYAFLQKGSQTDVTERAYLRTVADSIIKDFCYKHRVRNDILAYVRNDLAGNADNFWQPNIDREAILQQLENKMAAEAENVIENLEQSNFISSLEPYALRGWGGIIVENYRFPWDRAFEIGMDIGLGTFTESHRDIFGVYYQ